MLEISAAAEVAVRVGPQDLRAERVKDLAADPGGAGAGGGEPHPPGPEREGRIRPAASGPGLASERARAGVDRGVRGAGRGGPASRGPREPFDRPGPESNGSEIHVDVARHEP